MLMYPTTVTDIAGIVVVGAVIAIQYLSSKKEAATA
jgi:hypothetical protein